MTVMGRTLTVDKKDRRCPLSSPLYVS